MRTLLSVIVLAVGLAGCASTPTNFFTLVPKSEPSTGAAASTLRVGLENVEVASFVDRAELVTLRADSEVDLSQTNAWAEPVEDMATRVLAEDLAIALNVDQIFRLPTRRFLDLDRVVEVDILALNAIGGDQVQMTALWRVYDARDNLVRSGRTNVTTPYAPGESASPRVLALSAAFGELAPTIADAIRSG